MAIKIPENLTFDPNVKIEPIKQPLNFDNATIGEVNINLNFPLPPKVPSVWNPTVPDLGGTKNAKTEGLFEVSNAAKAKILAQTNLSDVDKAAAEVAMTADGYAVIYSAGHRVDLMKLQGLEGKSKQEIANLSQKAAQTGAGEVKLVSRIEGDPHVDQNGDGVYDFHYGEDSKLMFGNNTLYLNSVAPDPKNPHIMFTKGFNLVSGKDLYSVGQTPNNDVPTGVFEAGKAAQFEATHKKDYGKLGSGGVFAITDSGEWAIKAPNGNWYDVKDESWESYLESKDVDAHGEPLSLDVLPAAVRKEWASEAQSNPFLAENWKNLTPEQKEEIKKAVDGADPYVEQLLDEDDPYRKQFTSFNEALQKGDFDAEAVELPKGITDIMSYVLLIMMRASRQQKKELLALTQKLHENTEAQKNLDPNNKQDKKELDRLSLTRQEIQNKIQMTSQDASQLDKAISNLMDQVKKVGDTITQNLK